MSQPVLVERLQPNRNRNPNRMESEQYEKLKASIKKFGFLEPILVRGIPGTPDYEIISGHHRAKAATELGMNSVPCVFTDASDEDALALMVGMNRIRGELDLAIVAEGFLDLTQNGWSIDDLTVTGFSTQEVEDLLASTRIGTDDILDQPVATPEEDGEEAPSAFVLEIEFGNKDDMVACRKALKRAAGKGGDLGSGLIRALGLETGG
jgi:ParB-like chromosome segregation protein Spo0J